MRNVVYDGYKYSVYPEVENNDKYRNDNRDFPDEYMRKHS